MVNVSNSLALLVANFLGAKYPLDEPVIGCLIIAAIWWFI
jgi:hypothetical protein